MTEYKISDPVGLTEEQQQHLRAALEVLCKAMDACGVQTLEGKESRSPSKGGDNPGYKISVIPTT
jgi:hypothetical protein